MARRGRLHATRGEQVLHADRHARQRLQRSGGAVGSGLFRGGKRMLGGLDDEGVERLRARDIGVERLGDLDGAEIARAVAVADLRDGEIGQIRSEEHTSELQSLMRISYAVFCLKKKIN